MAPPIDDLIKAVSTGKELDRSEGALEDDAFATIMDLYLTREQILEQGELLGEGAKGLVYFVPKINHNFPVFKTYGDPRWRRNIEQESDVLMELNDKELKSVVNVSDELCLDDTSGDVLGSWMEKLEHLTLESIQEHHQAIRNALHEIKEAGYTHNDIHQNNIMWDPATKQIKLIDFGEARKVDDNTQLSEDDYLSK
ncbi:MAG: hypothetical protein Q9165_005050 [Trypethelium subeluteriae]